MINRNTLIALAAATFALFILNASLGKDWGEGNAFLTALNNILWFAFLACALALIVSTAAVLIRSIARTRRTRSSGA
jgi:hypothetical protein